jgi:rhamnosyl/mannosyltransferase
VAAFRNLAREADVIHLHQQNPLADLAVLLTKPSAPVVVTCHSAIVRQRLLGKLWKPVLTRVRHRAAQVVVASPPLAGILTAENGLRQPPRVIPFGIDLSAIRPAGDVTASREGCPAPLLLSVGRFVSYKGFEYLIEALAHVPRARLALVGDGPLRTDLQQLAQRVGVVDRVEFAGVVSDERLAELYRYCEVFVLPSVTPAEAFGMVQLEAMAYGKPVVSTDLPTGVPWVNRHGETGLVVAPRDPRALAEAITTLLASAELRRCMGTAGRRRVEQEFTAERMVCRYLELYEQVCKCTR